MAAKRRKEKRAIALSIIEELHNLQPPGRFLIEDVTRRDNKDIDNRDKVNNCSKDDNDGIHPAILKRAWVKVANDKAMVKVMHSLRQKVNGATSISTDGNTTDTTHIKNKEEEDFISPYKLDDDCANNLDIIGDDLLQRLYSLGDDEEESAVGQYDDLFDDTDVVGKQADGLLDNAIQESTEKEKNYTGQFDGLFDTAEENVVEQSDDVFDSAYDGGNNTTIVATTTIIPHENVSVDDIDFCIFIVLSDI